MKITLLTVGRIKEKYWRDAIAEYSKRLSRYCKLEIIEVEDENTPDGASEAEESKIKQKEGARLLAKIPERSHVIAMAIDGKSYDSIGFSKKIQNLGLQGQSNLVFIIGGSLGLSTEVLRRADEKISFSALTFPHQMMRVILLEQIYRGFRIAAGEPYHK